MLLFFISELLMLALLLTLLYQEVKFVDAELIIKNTISFSEQKRKLSTQILHRKVFRIFVYSYHREVPVDGIPNSVVATLTTKYLTHSVGGTNILL